MDLQRKTIQGLARSLDEKRAELAAFYGQFGARLLGESADPASSGPPVSAERVASWKALMATREQDTKAVLGIKACMTRMQELQQFRKELDRNLNAETARYREELGGLGRSVFERYGDYDESLKADFADAYERAKNAGEALARLEEKRERLQRELEESGFFGQMLVQFRMAGLASNVRQHKARVAAILREGAERLVSKGAIARKAESGELDPESAGRYRAIQEIESRRDELKRREASLDDDQAAVRAELELYAAADSPARRAEELRAKIRETDKRIDGIVLLAAREYSDKFIDEEGSSVLGGGSDGSSFSDMGSYSWQLEEVSRLRSEIAHTRLKIETLELGLKIESLERSVSGWKRSRDEAERKIEALHEQIAKCDRGIADAESEIARLAERREELEKRL
jgi:chromosome segregation ATPase